MSRMGEGVATGWGGGGKASNVSPLVPWADAARGGRMSAGGAGIPRLQDLSYIEVAVGQVAANATFEQIRRALVSRAAELARDADNDGSFDERVWDSVKADGTKHVHNTVEVLKELMRLGWLDRHILPSGPSSAYLHADARFDLTSSGEAWSRLVRADRRAAYNALLGHLIDAHPQMGGYLRVVGARPDSSSTHLTIPLLRWDGARHGSEATYLDELVGYVYGASESGAVAWMADRETIDAGIRDYVGRIRARLDARKKPQSRKQFVNSCDEAVTKVAFAAAGCNLDFISMELLRRWTRFLGVANFSYYAPGPYALRLWATGVVTGSGDQASITRRVGPDVRRVALEGIAQVWQERRAAAAAGMFIPIWELRAAVCWQQRITDDEFDKAVAESLAGVHPGLGFRIHLDQASVRATPASTRPLVLPTDSGVRRVFNVVTIIPTTSKEEK